MRSARLSVLLALAAVAACVVQPPKPPQPPATKSHTVQVQVTPDGALQAATKLELNVDLHGDETCVTEGVALTCHLRDTTPVPFGAHLDVQSPSFKPYHLDFVLQDVPLQTLTPIELEPVQLPRKTWTRDYRMDIHMVFAGETICTQQYGCQPWFEPAYQTLNSVEDRASVRQQKRDKYRDTHIILECFTFAGSIYDEPGVWLQAARSRSCEQEPDWFKSLIDEVVTEGDASLVPIVVYDGDNGSVGHQNAMRQLPFLNALLSGYDDSVVWARFWDGVFYGATPEEITTFGSTFRASHGNDAVLAIEHQPGRIPVGGGQRDYTSGGAMNAYDVVVGEFDSLAAIKSPPPIVNASWDEEHGGYKPNFASDASSWMNIWQILARTTFGYRAPSNQPFDVNTKAIDGPQAGQTVSVSSDNRSPTVYLVNSPRGPRRYWTFEDGEYEWTRNQVSFADLKREGDYYRATGATNVCLP
jgi:hypothetical protein